MKNDLLKEYKILSILGLPFFAVKDDEERAELQTVVRLKLREVKDLSLIEEPNLTELEKYFDELADKRKRAARWSFNKIRFTLIEVSLIFVFIIKHFVIRVGIKKQICEEEVRMFAETATEAIEYGREKRIKKLAGID